MMFTFTKNNCIAEALISPGPIFISGLSIVAKSRDHNDALSDIIIFHTSISKKKLKLIVCT